MIGYLNGTVYSITPPTLLLEVHGVGYIVYTPGSAIQHITPGEPLQLFIHDHIREDSRELYGFLTPEDLELFTHLISVSGIGPKTGVAALNIASSSHLRSAIIHGDASLLQRVPGIGQKTAQRVVLELKERLAKEYGEQMGVDHSYRDDADVIDALVGLGYAIHNVQTVISEMSPEIIGMQNRLKTALQLLSKL
ncbi:MAG: Holliday junction branch migration protein RuvA [Patescibacteria group bacterium]